MIKKKEELADVGVIVGRFQVPELHESHRSLIEYVLDRHDSVIIVLGSPRDVLLSIKNPLSFEARLQMIKYGYRTPIVVGLEDCPTNQLWSSNLDRIIEKHVLGNSVCIYGGRDSFIPFYTGRYDTIELDYDKDISGTKVRKVASLQTRDSVDWRAGVIYGISNRYPIVYPTVDICLTKSDDSLFLVKKPQGWSLPGGFVDPGDTSYLAAAQRELREELGGGIETGSWEYVGSFRVDDWRYRGEVDGIMTTIFKCHYLWGNIKLSDDLEGLEYMWATREWIMESNDINESHKQFVDLVL